MLKTALKNLWQTLEQVTTSKQNNIVRLSLVNWLNQLKALFSSNTLSHRILSGGFWVLLGKLIAIPIGVLINAYIRRILPIEAVGVYDLIGSFIIFGVLFVSLGFDQALIRFIAQQDINKTAFLQKNLLKLFTFIATVALILSIVYFFFAQWIIARFYNSFNQTNLTSLIIIVSLLVFLFAIQKILAESFRGFQDLHLASLLTGTRFGVLTSFLFLIAILLLYFIGQTSLSIVLLCLVFACIISVVLAIFFMFKRLSALQSVSYTENSDNTFDNDNPLPSLWQIAWPLWISNFISLGLMQLDLLVVGFYYPGVDTGIYSTPRSLMQYVLMPLVIVNMVVPPIIAQLYAKKDLGGLERTLQTTATVAGIPAFLAVLGVIFFAEPVLTLYGGKEEYALGSTVLIIMSLGQLVNVFAGSCMPALAMTGHQRYNMIISIIVGVFTVAAYFLVVPRFGLTGAAIVVALTLCLRNALATYFVKQQLGIWVFADPRKLKDTPKLLKSILGSR